jgi:hypothetical protein
MMIRSEPIIGETSVPNPPTTKLADNVLVVEVTERIPSPILADHQYLPMTNPVALDRSFGDHGRDLLIRRTTDVPTERNAYETEPISNVIVNALSQEKQTDADATGSEA